MELFSMDLHFGFVGLLCRFSQCPLSAVRELAEKSESLFCRRPSDDDHPGCSILVTLGKGI